MHAFVLNETREVESRAPVGRASLWTTGAGVRSRSTRTRFHDERALGGRVVETLVFSRQALDGIRPHACTVARHLGPHARDLLGEGYDPAQLRLAIAADNGEYYVRMMIAWYLAEALAPSLTRRTPWRRLPA